MSNAAIASSFPSGLTLTGGIPLKSQDLAASIIFTIAFALLIPLAIWRWASPRSRTSTLLRPSIVLVVRIVTYIIRAVEANGNYSKELFIAEQVLLLAGLAPLVEPVVVLLRAHVHRTWTPVPPAQAGEFQKEVTLLNRALRALQAAVLAALILGIVAGSKAGGAIDNPDAASDLKTYRYAAIGLTLFVLGLSILVTCAMHVREGLPTRSSAFILLICSLLLTPSIYKLVTSLHNPSMLSAGTKAAFYLLSALPEFLVVVLYFSINLNDCFDLKEASWKDKVEKKMKKGEWPAGTGYLGKHEYDRLQGRESSLEMQDGSAYKV